MKTECLLPLWLAVPFFIWVTIVLGKFVEAVTRCVSQLNKERLEKELEQC